RRSPNCLHRSFDRMSKGSLPLYTLTLFIAGSILWAYSTPVDITIQLRGVVRPDGEVVRVVAETGGRITSVSGDEGEQVHEGDVLVQLDTRVIVLKQRTLESRIHETQTRFD